MRTAVSVPSKRQKIRYVKVWYGKSSYVSTPVEADAHRADLAKEKLDGEYRFEDVWMTPTEFEALPEFEGF